MLIAYSAVRVPERYVPYFKLLDKIALLLFEKLKNCLTDPIKF